MTSPISQSIARKLDALPRHLKTPPIFRVCQLLWYRKYDPAPVSADLQSTLERLETNGYVILPELFSKPEVAEMRAELNGIMHSLRENCYKGVFPSYRFPEDGVYRLLRCDEAAPSTGVFFDHPVISELARGYVSRDVTCYQKQAELRADVALMSGSDIAHFDDWRHRLKAFVYLDDVSQENAPLTYFRGSHRRESWRQDKEFEYFKNHKDGMYGFFGPNEIRVLKETHGHCPAKITGPAGTTFLVDTRGVHSGTVLRQNQRLTLCAFFDVRKQEPEIFFISQRRALFDQSLRREV